MRRHAIVLMIAAGLVWPATVGAQSLGELAKEQEKKKDEKKESVPSYTATDLRRGGSLSTGAASVPANRVASETAEGESGDGEGGEGSEGEAEKTPAEVRAEAQTAWQERLTAAEADVTRLQGEVEQLEQAMAATAGMYNSQREGRAARLEQARAELATAQQSVAALRTEGRRNAYRR